jgi:hypothetical protein
VWHERRDGECRQKRSSKTLTDGAVEWEDIINTDAKEGYKSVMGFSDTPERSTKGGKFLDQLNN